MCAIAFHDAISQDKENTQQFLGHQIICFSLHSSTTTTTTTRTHINMELILYVLIPSVHSGIPAGRNVLILEANFLTRKVLKNEKPQFFFFFKLMSLWKKISSGTFWCWLLCFTFFFVRSYIKKNSEQITVLSSVCYQSHVIIISYDVVFTLLIKQQNVTDLSLCYCW